MSSSAPHAALAFRYVMRLGYLGLLALSILWESWLAPVSYAAPWVWAVLKVAPLLLPIAGVWREERRALIGLILLSLPLLTESVVLAWQYHAQAIAWSHPQPYAWIELVLVIVTIASAGLLARHRH